MQIILGQFSIVPTCQFASISSIRVLSAADGSGILSSTHPGASRTFTASPAEQQLVPGNAIRLPLRPHPGNPAHAEIAQLVEITVVFLNDLPGLILIGLAPVLPDFFPERRDVSEDFQSSACQHIPNQTNSGRNRVVGLC